MSEALVEASDVSKTVSGREILAPVSFSLVSGEGVVLTGPNGSGKITLLKILAGRDLATEGSVRWNDSLDQRAGVATVLGDPPYFENLTVQEHAEHGGLVVHRRDAAARAVPPQAAGRH